ncbi:MAG: LmbE family protein [Segetibacter sp.]|nr:LmbE family protein [Segetibacter sp.]
MRKPLKIFILSPHIDDAAFGLALTINELANNKIPVTIINCFTVTKWTAITVSNKEINAVSQLRKAEDHAFYKAIGNITIINLDLLDAPLRNGYIFQNQPFQQNELELIAVLEQLLEKHVDGLLFCPLAIGNHIDHAICRQAVIHLYKKLNVIFFEDLPYTQRVGEDQVRRHIHVLQEELGVELTNKTTGITHLTFDKEQAISIYKSQLNDEIVSEIMSHKNAMKGERLWGEQTVLDLLEE